MADYPSAIPVLTDEVGSATDPLSSPSLPDWALHISQEVEAIATELGTNPSAGYATVLARLNDLQPLDADLTDIAAIADAHGDIIVRGSAGWQRLAPDNGKFLRSNGAGSDPSWEAASASTSRIIPLEMSTAVTPDGSGSGNNPATPEKVVSGGTQTTNSPKATYLGWLFDPTTDEHLVWHFQLPADYASGGTLRGKFSNKGTSANQVRWKGAAAIAVSGTTDRDAIVFDTVVGTSSTPDTTTGDLVEFTLTLTMTNAAANRAIIVFVGRDPDHADDTNASDMRLEELSFEYTAS